MSETQRCLQCFSENPIAKRFCADCGAPFSSANAATTPISSLTQSSHESFGWPHDEETQVVPRPAGAMSGPLPDVAGCPQCYSSQTQSFEMAYSVSTSSANTAGGAYTFGVGPTIAAARTVQQSNLASYVSPPIKPTSTSGCAMIIVAFIGASVVALIAGNVAALASPEAQAGVSVLVWILSLIGIILLWTKTENQKTKDNMALYNNNLEEWRRWWICLRCGHRWRR